jgi:hypothetical protein
MLQRLLVGRHRQCRDPPFDPVRFLLATREPGLVQVGQREAVAAGNRQRQQGVQARCANQVSRSLARLSLTRVDVMA